MESTILKVRTCDPELTNYTRVLMDGSTECECKEFAMGERCEIILDACQKLPTHTNREWFELKICSS